MKNSKILLTFVIFTLASSLYVQDDDLAKYKERQGRTYNEFKDREKSEYRSFQDSINKEFASHISKTWKEYSVFVGEEPEKEPKPKNIPVTEPNSAPENDVEIEIEDGKYIVCDPTYYGASAGMSMPQYQNLKLSVIELNRLKMYE